MGAQNNFIFPQISPQAPEPDVHQPKMEPEAPAAEQKYHVSRRYLSLLDLPVKMYTRRELLSGFISFAISNKLISQDMKQYELSAHPELAELLKCESFPSNAVFNKLWACGIIKL